MLHMNIQSRRAQSTATAATRLGQNHKTRSSLCRFASALVLPLGIAAIAVPLVIPKPAEAWWRGSVWIGGPAYVPYAPPVVYAPPPVVYAPPPVYVPPTHWVPAHYILAWLLGARPLGALSARPQRIKAYSPNNAPYGDIPISFYTLVRQ